MTGEGNFIWYELMTSDPDAAARFYSAVIGWNCNPVPQTSAAGAAYHIFSIPGFEMGIAGMMALTPDMVSGGGRPGWIGYVFVSDVDAKAAEFAENGGSVHMPPTDIPQIGRFAVVADPHGAVIYIFKPQMPEGPMPDMPEPGTPGTVGWNELYASDGVEAFTFYSKMFGWQKSKAMDMGSMGVYQLFSVGGPDVGAVMTKTAEMPAPFWNYYLAVEALDKAVETATSMGATLINGPMEVPGGNWVISAIDPQGAMFSLLAPKR